MQVSGEISTEAKERRVALEQFSLRKENALQLLRFLIAFQRDDCFGS
jgi:hypothetical protein